MWSFRLFLGQCMWNKLSLVKISNLILCFYFTCVCVLYMYFYFTRIIDLLYKKIVCVLRYIFCFHLTYVFLYRVYTVQYKKSFFFTKKTSGKFSLREKFIFLSLRRSAVPLMFLISFAIPTSVVKVLKMP